jgi:hypothetical protein
MARVKKFTPRQNTVKTGERFMIDLFFWKKTETNRGVDQASNFKTDKFY